MPKSKRDKSVQKGKEGKEQKESIVNGDREGVEKYNYVYVFSFENMRNVEFKEFKQKFRYNGRFFLGLNKVMKFGLGLLLLMKSVLPSPNLCTLLFYNSLFIVLVVVSRQLRFYICFGMFFPLPHGDVGLLIMDMPKEEVEKVELKEGPLEQFTHEMEPFLRK